MASWRSPVTPWFSSTVAWRSPTELSPAAPWLFPRWTCACSCWVQACSDALDGHRPVSETHSALSSARADRAAALGSARTAPACEIVAHAQLAHGRRRRHVADGAEDRADRPPRPIEPAERPEDPGVRVRIAAVDGVLVV